MTTDSRPSSGVRRDRSPRELMVDALDSAIRAPSTHNTQPWIFGIDEEPAAITVHADTARALPVADPNERELFVSCATIVHHLRVALAARGRSCSVERMPDPADRYFVARLTLGPEIVVHDEALALEAAMLRRTTDNGPFDRDAVLDAAARERVQRAVESEGASLLWLIDEPSRAHVADLVAIADRAQSGDGAFREELAQWLRTPLSDRRDGIRVQGARGLLEPWLLRTFDRGDGEAARDRALIADGSPLLALITTATDTPMDWIRAGESLSALLLRVESERYSASYFAQVIEVDATREALRSLAGQRFVQVVLRVGRGQAGRRSDRRPVSAMLRR